MPRNDQNQPANSGRRTGQTGNRPNNQPAQTALQVPERREESQGHKNRIRLGAAWLNTDGNGQQYLSGNLNGAVKLLIFPNGYKRTDNDPDYIIYLAQRDKPAQPANTLEGTRQRAYKTDDSDDFDDPFAEDIGGGGYGQTHDPND